jgi:hypothetical protein
MKERRNEIQVVFRKYWHVWIHIIIIIIIPASVDVTAWNIGQIYMWDTSFNIVTIYGCDYYTGYGLDDLIYWPLRGRNYK